MADPFIGILPPAASPADAVAPPSSDPLNSQHVSMPGEDGVAAGPVPPVAQISEAPVQVVAPHSGGQTVVAPLPAVSVPTITPIVTQAPPEPDSAPTATSYTGVSPVFGAGLRPLGPNHWVVPRIAQGELPNPTEDGTINDGLFIASFVKDEQGSLGLNVSEVSSCGYVNVTGLKQGFEERWDSWGNTGNIRPLDAITHVNGRCVIGYNFTEVVQCLKMAPLTCTITFARGVSTLRAVSVQSWRTKEVEFGRTREVPNMPKLFGVRIADESIVRTRQQRWYVAELVYNGEVGVMGPFQTCAEAAGAYDTMLLSLCGLSAAEFSNFATHLVDMSQPKLPLSRLSVTRAVQFPAIPMMANPRKPATPPVMLPNQQRPASQQTNRSYIGVTRVQGGFRAEAVNQLNQHVQVGIYPSDVEAALAYDRFVRHHYGPGMRTNFDTDNPPQLAVVVAERAKREADLKSRRGKIGVGDYLLGAELLPRHHEQITNQILAMKYLANGGLVPKAILGPAITSPVQIQPEGWASRGTRGGRGRGRGASTASPAFASPAPRGRGRGGRGRGRGRGRRRDDDEYETGSEDDGTGDGVPDHVRRKMAKEALFPIRRSSRSSAQVKKSYNFDESGEEDEEEERLPPKSAAKRAGGQQPNQDNGDGTSAGVEGEGDEQVFTLADTLPAVKIDKVLGIRYSDFWAEENLESTGDSDTDDDEKEALEEDMRKERHLMRRRMKLPLSERRQIDALEYLVKWRDVSHLHVEWVTSSLMREYAQWGIGRMNRMVASPEGNEMLDDEEERVLRGRPLRDNSEYFDPQYLDIDRIVDVKEEEVQEWTEPTGEPSTEDTPSKPDALPGKREIARQASAEAAVSSSQGPPTLVRQPPPGVTVTTRKRRMYLVKWQGLGYSQATWEWEEDVSDDTQIAKFHRFQHAPSAQAIHPAMLQDVRPDANTWKRYAESPKYKGERTLRSYQLEGLNWLVFSWYQRRSVMLADEMGLGKTIQTVAILEHLRSRENVRGPFLIIAPLSTLEHWKREFEDWTNMNVVVYHDAEGGADGREVIRNNEFYFDERTRRMGIFKFNVLITSNSVVLKDWQHFEKIRWRYVVVDEAHSLKNKDSQLSSALKTLKIDSLLLLTGTPLQNNVEELWSLLNLIQPGKFSSLHDFINTYGGLSTTEEVSRLQAELRPLMLRRVKEDVEKSIPPKQETVIDVELTNLQKQYYRAIFERNRTFLQKGAGNMGIANLNFIEMELRKCCNHPFLLRGVEERETGHMRAHVDRLTRMINCSGKLVLLDKLLPKLKAEGHKVLIFSQFKAMLNILEKLLQYKGYLYERLDGSLRGNVRQAAIDRFNDNPDEFVFLISTRAGGVGINLTSADTVIIFDSDWNPQNDLQATSRCHRIGQTATVRVYRLVTKKTYESEMFRRASKKLGLSQAVFETGGIRRSFNEDSADEPRDGGLVSLLKLDKDKVEMLLRFGAYAIMDDDSGAADTFCEADIDTILGGSKVITYELPKRGEGEAEAVEEVDGAGSSSAVATGGVQMSFAKATFRAEGSDQALDLNDPSFWEKVLGPKPAQRLLSDLTEDKLDGASDDYVTKFTLELRGLVEAILNERAMGNVHEDQETVSSILIELSVRGKNIPLTKELMELMPTLRFSNSDNEPEPDEDGEGEEDGKKKRARRKKEKPLPSTISDLAFSWAESVEGRKRQRRNIVRLHAMVQATASIENRTPSGKRRGRPPGSRTKSRVAEENIYIRLRLKPASEDAEVDEGDASYGIVAIFSTATGRTVPDPKTRRATTEVPRWMLEHAPRPPPGEVEDVPEDAAAQDSEEFAGTSDEYAASEPEKAPPTKRRRGRPPKNPQAPPSARQPRATKRVQFDDDDDDEDMDDVYSDVSDPEPVRRRRSRPATKKAAPAPAPVAIAPVESDDDNIKCCVCGSTDGSEDDPIVLCDSCNMGVHKLCYGIDQIPEGEDPWHCAPCALDVKPAPSCPMCPVVGGAYKPTNDGDWAHVVCALWADCPFGNVATMEPICGVSSVPASECGHVCTICNSDTGFTVKCAHDGCTVRFHATCGRNAGYTMALNANNRFEAFCPQHSHSAAPAPVPAVVTPTMSLAQVPTSEAVAAPMPPDDHGEAVSQE